MTDFDNSNPAPDCQQRGLMAAEELDALVNALRSGEQADMDGCRVKVSRQACDEAADIIESMADAITALRAERDGLKSRLNQAIHAGNVACEIADAKDAEVKRLTQRLRIALDRADAAEARALAAEAAALDAARVKPLVWGGGVFFGQPAHFADIEFGRLMVVDHRTQGKGIKAYDTAGDSIGVFDDADAAKAALEADYEARIRAALAEPSPAARTALDAALADARKAGKLEGLREAKATAEALPRRKEPLGGQTTSYVQLETVAQAIDALAARVEGETE